MPFLNIGVQGVVYLVKVAFSKLSLKMNLNYYFVKHFSLNLNGLFFKPNFYFNYASKAFC
jgi:hypothetical protein